MIDAPANDAKGEFMVANKLGAQRQPANLAHEQMRAAIPKLRRRIDELAAFDPETVTDRRDARIDALDKKLDDTIAEIFGMGSTEYERFRPRDLDNAGYLVGGTPLGEVIDCLFASKERELANLRTIVELFEERMLDGNETPTSRAQRVFGDLDLHPEIERACGQLFRDGHYANTVEDACKVLDMLVKLRAMRTDPSGTELMQLVFSPKSPILKFNDQQNESERSQQQGTMFLFAGAMLAIRNPRAHGIVQDHPERAVEYLSFISMLAKSLDDTTRA